MIQCHQRSMDSLRPNNNCTRLDLMDDQDHFLPHRGHHPVSPSSFFSLLRFLHSLLLLVAKKSVACTASLFIFMDVFVSLSADIVLHAFCVVAMFLSHICFAARGGGGKQNTQR